LVLIGLLISFIALAPRAARALHRFRVEAAINGEFWPVMEELHVYQTDHGAPAASLAALIPHYRAHLPTSPYVDAIDYTLLDGGTAWQLSIHTRALGRPLIYRCRSTQFYTPQEQNRILKRCYGYWVVLPDDERSPQKG
jgi:hypothetical protein